MRYGYLNLDDQTAAMKLGMHVTTYKKYINSLIEKGYIDFININGMEIKRFDFNPNILNVNE